MRNTALTPLLGHLLIPCAKLARTEWIEKSFSERKAVVEHLLEGLEHRDAEFRFTNARRLFYILQGRERVRTEAHGVA